MRRYIVDNRGIVIDGSKLTLHFSDIPIEIDLGEFEIPMSNIIPQNGAKKTLVDQVLAFADRELENFGYNDFVMGVRVYQAFFYLGKYLPFRPSYIHTPDDFDEYMTAYSMNFYNIQATGYYYLGIEWLKKYTYDLIEFLTAWDAFFIQGDVTIPQMMRISVATSAKVTDYKLLQINKYNIELDSCSEVNSKSCEWSG